MGVNLPARTVILTGEMDSVLYHQMGGRAGRRGIDTIGYVVHCNNLFKMPTMDEYKKILRGKPQQLRSKFHISYSVNLPVRVLAT